MIYFDLDGVLRDLAHRVLRRHPTKWDDKTDDGESIIRYVSKNLDVLWTSAPTRYLTRREYEVKRIITSQPKKWRKITMDWINFHIRGALVTFVEEPEDKLQYLGAGDYLVEDYPYFNDYSKIILIDKAYNKNVLAPFKRVSTPKQLGKAINEVTNE